MAFVYAAGAPFEFTVSVLLIMFVLSSVLVAVLVQRLPPVTLSVLLTVIELTAVRVAVAPVVLSEAFSFAPLILTNVAIAIFELVLTLSVPQAQLPFAFIPVAAPPDVLSESIWFVLFPLTNIRIVINSLPNTVTFLVPIVPLTVIELAAGPSIPTLSVHSSITILTQVRVAVAELLEAQSSPLVIHPVSFVDSTRVVRDDSFAMSLAADEFASVQAVLVGLHLEIRQSHQHLVIYQFIVKRLVVQVALQLFFVFYDYAFLLGVQTCR